MQLDDCIGQKEQTTVSRTPDEREMLLKDVMPGDRLLTELRTDSGALLVPFNFEITKTLLDRISNIHPNLMTTRVRISVG